MKAAGREAEWARVLFHWTVQTNPAYKWKSNQWEEIECTESVNMDHIAGHQNRESEVKAAFPWWSLLMELLTVWGWIFYCKRKITPESNTVAWLMSLQTAEILVATRLGTTCSNQLLTFETKLKKSQKSAGGTFLFARLRQLILKLLPCRLIFTLCLLLRCQNLPTQLSSHLHYHNLCCQHTPTSATAPPLPFFSLHVYVSLCGEKILSTIASGRMQTAFFPHSNNFDKSKYPVAPTTKAGFTLAVPLAT